MSDLPPPPMPIPAEPITTDTGTDTTTEYVPESHEERKDRREILMAVMLVVLLLMMGGIGASELSRITTAAKNTPILNQIKDQTAIIKDTVDPGGKRFQRAQAAGAASVATVNEITVLTVFCAKTHDELVDIRECVQMEYLKLHH